MITAIDQIAKPPTFQIGNRGITLVNSNSRVSGLTPSSTCIATTLALFYTKYGVFLAALVDIRVEDTWMISIIE